MVTMEGCVNVVGVAGRYLGLEEPVKLIRGWVLLAVSFCTGVTAWMHVRAVDVGWLCPGRVEPLR